MIGDLLATLFLSRELAHRAHLKVSGPGSYARHEALGGFYATIVAKADALAEAYQGRGKPLPSIPIMSADPNADIVRALSTHLKWIEAHRYDAVPMEDSPLQNLIDEICGLYLSTLYKLKNLA